MRTPITYYGGKQRMIKDIVPMIDAAEHSCYTEVFFGGGAIFWAKRPSDNETINDKNDFVVNFYEVLQRQYKWLKKRIDSSLVCRKHKEDAMRIWRKGGTKLERAWAFWFITNWSFAGKMDGGLKYSNEGYSSVPRQATRKKAQFTELLRERIENAVIENRDAIWVLKSRNVAGALHYIDPPYVGADQGHYKGYSQEDLNDLLEWMTTCRGKFIMSHYPNESIVEFANEQGWIVDEIQKALTADRGSNRKKVEILVRNFQTNQMKMAL